VRQRGCLQKVLGKVLGPKKPAILPRVERQKVLDPKKPAILPRVERQTKRKGKRRTGINSHFAIVFFWGGEISKELQYTLWIN